MLNASLKVYDFSAGKQQEGSSLKNKKWIPAIRELFRKYPVPGSAAAVAFALSLSRLSSQMLMLLPESILRDYLIPIGGILSTLLVVLLFGYQWCYHRGSAAKTVLAGLPLILFMGFMLVYILCLTFSTPDVEWLPPTGIILGILKLFEIGFLEESLFRGIVANGIGIRYGRDTKGVWLAVILSGLIFGTVHLLNASVGVNLLSALAQSVTAWIFGILFAAIYFRGGNIWVMIFIHALINSSGLFETLFTVTETAHIDAINASSFEGWYLYPVLLTFTILLLRKSKITEVIANLRSAAAEDELSSNSFIDKQYRK